MKKKHHQCWVAIVHSNMDQTDSVYNIKNAHVQLELFQIWIPWGAGNHQQKPYANIWQYYFETQLSSIQSKSLIGDPDIEATDIFQNSKDAAIMK